MKIITKGLLPGLFAFISLAFISCDIFENEDRDFGLTKVYMPQAAMQSGGADNNYYVPNGTSEWDKNYTIDQSGDNDHINVVLGVYRSGLQKLEAYSVEVFVRPDTVSQLIDNGTLSNAVILPDDAYTLPSTIDVSDGEREEIFYLTIDRKKLLDDYASFADQSLILAVAIRNPSRYELNTALSTTIVIVEEWETLE